jgi:hypothetical protein
MAAPLEVPVTYVSLLAILLSEPVGCPYQANPVLQSLQTIVNFLWEFIARAHPECNLYTVDSRITVPWFVRQCTALHNTQQNGFQAGRQSRIGMVGVRYNPEG